MIPTTSTWDLADFSGDTLEQMLGLPPGEMTPVPPTVGPYFSYGVSGARSIVVARSNDEVEASLDFHLGIPSRYTLDLLVRCPSLPHNLGDLRDRRFGVTLADDAGRGFTMYFAKTGIAISPVDDFGSVTALPDTSDVTQAVASDFYTVRVAVDGGLGRAYLFFGLGATDTPPLRAIVPVAQTPQGMGDVFRLFAQGKVTEPVEVHIASLRVAAQLVVANYPPVADAGPDRLTAIGNAVRLDGRGSYDVEGVPVTYKWQCVDVPYGSSYAVEISGASTTDDGDGDGVTSIVSLPPAQVPAWLAPGDVLMIQGSPYEALLVDLPTGLVELTSDAIADNLSAAPLRILRQSILVDTRAPAPTAAPDMPGLYRFRLIVSDGEVDSEPSEVLATVTPLQTPQGIEPDVSVLWKAIGDEWRFIEGAKLFEEAWIGTAQLLAGRLLEAWQYHYNTSIRDAQQTFLRKWVAFRTLDPETAPDEVVVGLRPGGFVSSGTGAAAGGDQLHIEVLLPDGSSRTVPVTLFEET